MKKFILYYYKRYPDGRVREDSEEIDYSEDNASLLVPYQSRFSAWLMSTRKIDASTLNYPATLGMHLIDFFNSSLSPGEPSREFIGTKEIDEDTRMKMENTMIKFEEHEGQLFRMLEEPEPLQPDSPMPCVVRLIQDDSPMGKFNKDLHAFDPKRLMPKICTEVIDVNDLSDHNRGSVRYDGFISCQYYHYELIGTPVVEGSAEWALYQMMQGKKVIHKYTIGNVCCALNQDGNVQYYHTDNLAYIGKIRSKLEFVKKNVAKTGWHLYKEPKSLLADARKGDLCQRRDGKWVQVDSYSNDRPCPIMCKSDIGGQDCFTLDGRNHNAVNDSKDIIHTEPLAPEGTAEWAWQMLNLLRLPVYHPAEGVLRIPIGLGVKEFVRSYAKTGWQIYKEPKIEPTKETEIVAHKQHATCLVCGKEIKGLLDGHATVSIKRYSISSLYESTYSHYCGKCFLELGFDATERELRNRQQPIAKPEPAQQYKVGDWVEWCGDQYMVESAPPQSGSRYDIRSPYEELGYFVYPENITRKLSPSEVIVNVGCLSGTVRPVSTNGIHMWFHLIGVDDKTIATIRISHLDAPTRELVKSLLEAMQEEK